MRGFYRGGLGKKIPVIQQRRKGERRELKEADEFGEEFDKRPYRVERF